MKLIEASITRDEQTQKYVVNGTVGEPLAFPGGYDVKGITVNGVEVINFGTTWSGIEIDRDMCFGILAAAYINDDSTVEVQDVCNELKSVKDFVQSYTHTVERSDGTERKIPNVVITPDGGITKLCAIARDTFYRTVSCFYAGGESCIVTREDGSVATDIEAIMMDALVDSAENDEVIFMDDCMKEWLAEEYGVDVDSIEDRKYVSGNDIIARKVFEAVHDANTVSRKIRMLSNDMGTMGVSCDMEMLGDRIKRWGTYAPDEGDEVYLLFGNGFVHVVKGATYVPSYVHQYSDPSVLLVSEVKRIPVRYDSLETVQNDAQKVADAVIAFLF